jgi:ABC-type transport system involved in multi-copper enzyme maturation permease subunit
MTTLVLAGNTFRESIRDRLVPAVLIFGAMLVATSVLLAPLTLGEHGRVVRDLGLSTINFFALLLIVMVGTGMVYREVERKTIHTILTLPVPRSHFLLGKFFGMYGTVLLSIAALGTMYVGVATLFGGGYRFDLVVAVAMVAMEAFIMTAIAVFFSAVASPVLSAVFTLFLWIAGNLASDLKLLAKQLESPGIDRLMDVIYVLLPSLHNFHVRNNLLNDVPVSPGQIGWCFAYAVLYAAGVMAVTIVAFGRKDFE